MTLNELRDLAYNTAKEKGFWEDERNFAECIALMHSELSEALEADRKGDWFYKNNKTIIEEGHQPRKVSIEDFVNNESLLKVHFKHTAKSTAEDELADTIIRILDYCGSEGIDIESHVKAKLAYNKTRPHKHGKEY